jgi:hypothetical protein
LGGGALEQDDFTLLQGKVEFRESWRRFYELSTQDTHGWMTSLDVIILFRLWYTSYAFVCVANYCEHIQMMLWNIYVVSPWDHKSSSLSVLWLNGK